MKPARIANARSCVYVTDQPFFLVALHGCLRMVLLLALVAWPALTAVSLAQSAVLPSVDELEARAQALAANPDLTEDTRRDLASRYRLAIDQLRSAEAFDRQALEFSQALTDRVQRQTALARERDAFRARVAEPIPNDAPVAALEQSLLDSEAQLAQRRSELTSLQSTLRTERELDLPELIEQARREVTESEQTVSAFAAAPAEERANGSAEVAGAVARASARRLAGSRLAMLEARLASRPARLAWLQARIDLLDEQNAALRARRDSLETLLGERRLNDGSARIQRAQAMASELANAPPAVQQLATRNIELANALADLQQHRQQTGVREALAETAALRLDARFASLNRLLSLDTAEASEIYGVALRDEQNRNRATIDLTQLRAQAEQALTESRVALFRIDERQPPHDRPSIAGLQVALGDDAGLWAPALQPLLDERQNLNELLAATHNAYGDELAALLDQLRYLTQRGEAYDERLKSHLFWIPSAPAMNAESLASAGNTLTWLQDPAHREQVGTVVRQNLEQRPLRTVAGLLVLLLALAFRRPFKKRLTEMVPLIGRVRTDRFALTLGAFVITFVLALPAALLIFLVADLTTGQGGFAASLGTALMTGASVLLFMEFMLQLVRDDGIAQAHFRWNAQTLRALRRNNRLLIFIVVPVATLAVLLDAQATTDLREQMGRILLAVLCLTLAWVAWQEMRLSRRRLEQAGDEGWRWSATWMAYPVAIAILLAILMLALLGYNYTAGQLLAMVVKSLIIGTCAIVGYFTVERASSVYERRLALERLLARRSATLARSADRDIAEASGEDIPDIIESHTIDRQKISTQTKTLLRLLAWIGLLAGLLWVWSDLLPVTRSLDDIVLWRLAPANPGGPSDAVTLWDLLLALAVATTSFIAVRNLPGALQVAFLSRMNLAPGTGYAVTTILKYLLVFAGLMTVVNLLGADWSKLQWLVAALGVGLGFGLQEIVANFVSGIVILFEKPFRLGDTITINGQSGTVTRIQMRATTISDWDRKELIIPNRTIVTSDLVNWTLTDSITRLIIPVGVAYGSNTDQVVASLLDIGTANDKVLDDPSPAALFLGFGASSLTFELRVFTRSVIDRLLVTHELHLAIDRVFRERGIEIAFPQTDVHLSAKAPLEVTLKRR